MLQKEAERRQQRSCLAGPGFAIRNPVAQEDFGDIPGTDDLEDHLVDSIAWAGITSTRANIRRSSTLLAALHRQPSIPQTCSRPPSIPS